MRGASAREIVAAPRFHHQYLPDVVGVEAGALDAQQRAQLTVLGHTLREGGQWGNLQVVVWDYATQTVEAASDPRGAGEGLSY
jgi:gamma-glutamyltranspeptidase/glutathione hydrolase